MSTQRLAYVLYGWQIAALSEIFPLAWLSTGYAARGINCMAFLLQRILPLAALLHQLSMAPADYSPPPPRYPQFGLQHFMKKSGPAASGPLYGAHRPR